MFERTAGFVDSRARGVLLSGPDGGCCQGPGGQRVLTGQWSQVFASALFLTLGTGLDFI